MLKGFDIPTKGGVYFIGLAFALFLGQFLAIRTHDILRLNKEAEKEFIDKEVQLRFEQALRGARIAGHKPMKDVLRKKPKKQREQDKKKRGSG